MNCPHCQKQIPEEYKAADCPFCGRIFSEAFNEPKRAFPWFRFVLILTAPAILDFLFVVSDSSALLGLMLLVTFGGTVAAGITCAVLLIRWQRNETGSSVLGKGILFSVLLSALSFGICFAGCGAGAILQQIAISRT